MILQVNGKRFLHTENNDFIGDHWTIDLTNSSKFSPLPSFPVNFKKSRLRLFEIYEGEQFLSFDISNGNMYTLVIKQRSYSKSEIDKPFLLIVLENEGIACSTNSRSDIQSSKSGKRGGEAFAIWRNLLTTGDFFNL